MSDKQYKRLVAKLKKDIRELLDYSEHLRTCKYLSASAVCSCGLWNLRDRSEKHISRNTP